jgi:hypothetical protein
MSPRHAQVLCRRYPALFRYPPRTAGSICLSSPGDGWIGLIDTLSSVVRKRVERLGPDARISDVKEKFGRLAVSFVITDDYIEGAAEMAGELSELMCEVCGGPGMLFRIGWYRTRCTWHEAQSTAGEPAGPECFRMPAAHSSMIKNGELTSILSGLIGQHEHQSGESPCRLRVRPGSGGSLQIRAKGAGNFVSGIIAMTEAWSRYQARGIHG